MQSSALVVLIALPVVLLPFSPRGESLFLIDPGKSINLCWDVIDAPCGAFESRLNRKRPVAEDKNLHTFLCPLTRVGGAALQ